MRKLLLLLALVIGGVGSALAEDGVFTIDFLSSGVQQVPAGYFTVAGSPASYVQTYDGQSYTGLKLDSKGSITFTTATTSTVTIVQCYMKGTTDNSSKTIKFDGTALDISSATTDEASKTHTYTINDVAEGTHTIQKGSGESGIFRVKVEYTGVALAQLDAPAITFDDQTGVVTITKPTGATKVCYTTDGTTPTAESTEYTAPFTVTVDGTIVKAIAIGDGTTNRNSEVASATVLLANATIAAPTISSKNGTVAIACNAVNVTIKYSLDGGATWSDYSFPFTIMEDKTVKAKAVRDAKESDVAEQAVAAVNAFATRNVVMGYGSFAAPVDVDYGGTQYSTLNGSAGDDAEGYSLILMKAGKAWASGNKITTVNKTSIKVSNGAQNKLTMPANVKANKVTFHSYKNVTGSNVGWGEINGETTPADDLATYDMGGTASNPDVRVYPLNGVTGEMTFTNAGVQICFVLELGVVDTPTLNASGFTTFVSQADAAITGAEAYTGKITGDKLVLTNIGTTVPANTAVVLYGTAGTKVDVNAATTAAPSVADNDLQGVLTATATPENAYVLNGNELKHYTGAKLHAGKAHVIYNAASGAKLSIAFGDETDGITAANAAKGAADAKAYNIMGQRVSKDAKGIVVINGKKHLNK